MQTSQSAKLCLRVFGLLACLSGCSKSGIDEPVPQLKLPDYIDPIAGSVISEKYKTLQQYPHSAEAWATFANACLVNEMYTHAISAYEVLISHNKTDADSIWRCAIAFYELGELDQAIELAEQNQTLFSCQAECSRRLAEWHFENGDPERAEMRLKDRESCDFDDYWMDVLEVEILISEGNFQNAQKIIQKYSLPYEENLYRLGELAARRLKDDGWMKALSEEEPKKNRIPPDSRIDCLSSLCRTVTADRRRANGLVAQPPSKETLIRLKSLHDARPADSFFAAAYAMNLLQLGQLEDAASTLGQMRLDREQWTAEYWMVMALVRAKQYEGSPNESVAQSMLEACLNVISVDPKHLLATQTLAKAYRIIGDFTGEAEAWKAASELASSTEEKLAYLCASFQATGRAGDWTRASSCFDLLLEEVPDGQANKLWGAAAQAAINAERRNQALIYIERLRTGGYEDLAIQLEQGLEQ